MPRKNKLTTKQAKALQGLAAGLSDFREGLRPLRPHFPNCCEHYAPTARRIRREFPEKYSV